MRALLFAALLLGACSSESGRQYAHNDLQLLTSYSAKELCSCLFVMNRDEGFCAAFTRASPNLKTVRIDWPNKRVETQAVLFWGSRARYLGPRRGCVAE